MASPGVTSQRAGQESPAAPTHAGGSRRPVLFLLSSDDGLLIELGPLLGDRYRTRPIDSAEQLEVPADMPWALLIDATTRNDARAQAARFEQQHPLAPLLVICADGNAADWAGARSRGMVSAVVERGSLQAGEFAEALRTMDRQLASDAVDAALAATQANEDTARRRSPRGLLLALGLLAAGALAWYLLRDETSGVQHAAAAPAPAQHKATDTSGLVSVAPSTAPAAAAATPTAPSVPRPVLELLSDARVAFRDGKALLPRTDEAPHGDSAFELYMQVLAQDPQNEEARDGLRRLFAVARSRIQGNLGAGKLDVTPCRSESTSARSLASSSDATMPSPSSLLRSANRCSQSFSPAALT